MNTRDAYERDYGSAVTDMNLAAATFDDPSVAAHEIGHRLGEVAAQRAGISEKDIVGRAAAKVGIKTENMAGHISGYARTNYGETIAEASCDVYCNGTNASKASIAIMAEVKSILG